MENVVLDRREISVILPCEIFDHPVLYRFKYRVSDSPFEAFIPQTLTLKWGEILLQTPTNHTALTRFSSLWIRHNRKCLPKYRDELNLYYIKGQEKIFVTRKYIRKLSNGKQRKAEGSWIRMGFRCEVFDTQGIYYFEYQAAYQNRTLAKSDSIHVYWEHQTLSTPASTIFPCTNSFMISYAQPRCRYVRSHDAIVMGDRYSEKPIAQKPVQSDHDVAFFPCSLFKDYVKEYCFHYVTKSSLTKRTVRVSSLCLPSHPPGKWAAILSAILKITIIQSEPLTPVMMWNVVKSVFSVGKYSDVNGLPLRQDLFFSKYALCFLSQRVEFPFVFLLCFYLLPFWCSETVMR